MNHRQQVAAMHARELAKAKQQLLLKVNQYIQEVRADGGNAEVVPQLQRLISLGSYRLRDVQKMRQIASDPKKYRIMFMQSTPVVSLFLVRRRLNGMLDT